MRSVKGFVEQWNYYGITEEESAVADTRLKEFNLAQLFAEVSDFFDDRLKVQQREAGVRHDLIDAVFALGGEDDLVRLLARVQALQGFMETECGEHLLAVDWKTEVEGTKLFRRVE